MSSPFKFFLYRAHPQPSARSLSTPSVRCELVLLLSSSGSAFRACGGAGHLGSHWEGPVGVFATHAFTSSWGSCTLWVSQKLPSNMAAAMRWDSRWGEGAVSSLDWGLHLDQLPVPASHKEPGLVDTPGATLAPGTCQGSVFRVARFSLESRPQTKARCLIRSCLEEARAHPV